MIILKFKKKDKIFYHEGDVKLIDEINDTKNFIFNWKLKSCKITSFNDFDNTNIIKNNGLLEIIKESEFEKIVDELKECE